MELRRFAIVFLTAESVGCVAWWIALATSTDARARFFPPQTGSALLSALAVADLTLFAGAAAASAVGLARRRDWAGAALLVHAGGALYAGLLALALWAFAPELWLGGVAMLPSTLIAPWLAVRLRGAAP